MKITVQHEVPYAKGYESKCHCADGTTFEGNSACAYHSFRDRQHGRKRPADRHCPKCTLFGRWLERELEKCPECMAACEESEGEHAE